MWAGLCFALQGSFRDNGNNSNHNNLPYLGLHMFKLWFEVQDIRTQRKASKTSCVNQQSPSFTTGCFFLWVGSKITPFFRASKTNCGTSNQNCARHSILWPAAGFQQSHSVGSCPSCCRRSPARDPLPVLDPSERQEHHDLHTPIQIIYTNQEQV